MLSALLGFLPTVIKWADKQFGSGTGNEKMNLVFFTADQLLSALQNKLGPSTSLPKGDELRAIIQAEVDRLQPQLKGKDTFLPPDPTNLNDAQTFIRHALKLLQ